MSSSMFSSKDLYHYRAMRAKSSPEHHEDAELAETLSLCDLALYSHSSSTDSSNSNSSSKDEISDELFEFVTEDFQTQAYQEKEQIIFCGKLISSREATSYQSYNIQSSSHKKKSRKLYLFRGIKRLSFSDNKADHGNLANVVTSATSSSSKIKWCSLVFGLQRFSVPTSTNIADLKYRQSRRSPKSLEMLGRSVSSSNNNSKLDQGLSYLIRSLSCRGDSISVLN